MAPNTDGFCCVCGTPTEKRCSGCGTAGFDLFFCSREHQKLVYFEHKKVCGPNAKPFRFPPLSATESLVDALSKEPSLSLSSSAFCTLSCLVRLGLENLHLFRPKTSAVPRVFHHHSDKRGRPTWRSEPVTTIASLAVGLGAESRATGKWRDFFSSTPDWYTELLHHALVFSALHERLLREHEASVDESSTPTLSAPPLSSNPPSTAAAKALLRPSCEKMHRILLTVEEAADPEVAPAVATAVDFFLKDSPFKLSLREGLTEKA